MKLLAGVLVATLLPMVPDTAARAQGVPRFGISIPMRDGIRLVADLYLPDSAGRFPTILLRTPYVKTPQFRRYKLAAYVQRGYAVVLQDTRGRGDSDGEFDFYFPEGKDGYDTIEWIAKQPWSNGRVGMDGGSYLGTVQWLAARERPPSLACIAPTAPSGRPTALSVAPSHPWRVERPSRAHCRHGGPRLLVRWHPWRSTGRRARPDATGS